MNLKKSSQSSLEAISNNDGSSFSLRDANIFPTLTQEEQSKALYLASQLDITRYETILRFGEEVQNSLKHFTHQLLTEVQRSDTSPIREILSQLIEQLDSIHLDDFKVQAKGLFGKLFKRKQPIQQLVSQYHRLSVQIDRLTVHLRRAQKNLLSDNEMLNKVYEKNEEFFQHIHLHIAALEMKKLDVLKEIQRLEKGGDLNNPLLEQKLADMRNAVEWLDRRMYDLQLSREISLQTAPQIRMIQSTNEMLIEKIQSSVLSTIPLWQSQISMLVNLNRQHRANETTKRLANASEKMAETINNAEHADLEQLKETQYQLIESIEETLKIQKDQNEKQQVFEKTIHAIEKNKEVGT
ncbi:toxic anion resistance protein [Ureibacillus thermophilus]|uniref:toxic anion resistance protein n=1 Tax=Ureibacillus thermophilus TaxID=367743 RepID=UPI00361FDDC0